jgi:hypothetical protein
LLLFQNTPKSRSGFSPAEILFGRVLIDGIPTKLDQYLPCSEASRNCGEFSLPNGEAQKYHSLEKLIKLHFRTPYQNGCEQLLLMNLYSGITLWRWKRGPITKQPKIP